MAYLWPGGVSICRRRSSGSGWALSDRSLGYRLPHSRRTQRTAPNTAGPGWGELGLLRGSGHEHFTGSLVIPIVDETGTVTEMYGRKLRDDLQGRARLCICICPARTVARGTRSAAGVARDDPVRVVIDALTFWCPGQRNVTAAYGVKGSPPST